MLKEEIINLFSIDKNAYYENGISHDILQQFDNFIINRIDNGQTISDEVFAVYKKFVSMKQEAPISMKNELFRAIINFIDENCSNNHYFDALILYRFLIVKSELKNEAFYNIAEVLNSLGDNEVFRSFLKLYEKKETNKPLMFITLANFYNLELKDYKTAIKYYEKYLEIDKTKPVVYTIVGSLYAKLYGDISLKDQIFYFEKAYNLKPDDRLILHSLAFGYEKLGDAITANRYYKELLENNPTEIDYYNYGAFLISCGEFEEGHKYFTHRFNIDDENLKYPLASDIKRKWDFKTDISDKTLLIHYEQGFGDTFMYCRFVPEMRKLAEKVIFVVQDSLCDLIKSSTLISNGIDVISDKTDLSTVDYDVHMALLDTPYVLHSQSDSLPYTGGYLELGKAKTDDYAARYIDNSDKLKVGIAYSGDKNANYNGRDIDVCKFNNLLKLENINFYSLQAGCNEDGIENLIALGSTFHDFCDTAAAIKNMDIVISTDNVILNLAGALGVKTFGLFNEHTNYRWYKLDGDNVGWYDSVQPLQVEQNNCWSYVFSKLLNIISEYSKEKLCR